MPRYRNEFKWSSQDHSRLLDIISGMSASHPEEFLQIETAALKVLKLYRTSENITEEQSKMLDDIGRDWYIDQKTGGVVVNYMYAEDWGLTKSGWGEEKPKAVRKRLAKFEKLKEIKFSYVSNLSIRRCSPKLNTLWYGFPQKCRSFDCSGNNIRSLQYGPKEALDYDCSHNELTSLSEVPSNVEVLACVSNKITTLSTIRSKNLLKLKCQHNELTNLIGCPPVKNWLDVSNNKLVSVEGAPMNLTLRDIDFSGNLVSEKTLKLAFNAMKKAKGDYAKGLSKIWKNIPPDDQIHMYQDNSYLTEEDVRRYTNLKKYSEIKTFI